MSTIQAIVLENLEVSPCMETDPLVIIKENKEIETNEFIFYINEAERSLKHRSKIWESAIALYACAELTYLSPDGEIEFIVQAKRADDGEEESLLYMENKLAQIRKEAEDVLASEIKSDTLSDIYSVLQFLGDILGSNLQDTLQSETGASKNTVKKWVLGSSPSCPNRRSIYRLAEKIYDAREAGELEKMLSTLSKRKKHHTV